MSELQELYQDIILDHNRNPRNFGRLEGADRTADGYNPVCGDRITLDLRLEDGRIRDVAFKGSGCAISRASASLMTEAVKGLSQEQAERLFHAFHAMLTRAPGEPFDAEELGDLEVLSGVAEYPARVKCATLAWHTLHAALKQEPGTVSTE
ncbi:MAG TPA: SUF system NifU family Fe-S cluster assembly protein [Dehalococcoidia bacterium]